MRRASVSIGLLLLLLGSSGPAQARTSFAGTWVLAQPEAPPQAAAAPAARGADADEASGAEEAGAADETAVSTIEAAQDEDKLTVKRHLSIGEQNRTSEAVLDLGGKEVAETGPRGAAIVTKTSWEGDKLVIVTTRTIKRPKGEIAIENRQTWSLSPDGKTLTIEVRHKGPRGERKRTLTYTKKAETEETEEKKEEE